MDAAHFRMSVLLATTLAMCVGTSATSVVAIESSGDFPDPPDTRPFVQGGLARHTASAHWWGEIVGTDASPDRMYATPFSAAGPSEQRQSAGFLGSAPATVQGTTWPGTLQAVGGILTAFLMCLFLLLLQAYGEHVDCGSIAPLRDQPKAATTFHQAFLAVAAAAAMATDSTIATLVVSTLPELCGGNAAPLLFFIRPAIASITAVVLLPAWIRKGAEWGHFTTSLGLLLLAISCLSFASAADISLALVGQITHAIASATIFVSVMHTRMQEATGGSLGLHLGAVLGGAAVGCSCAPWIGSTLSEFCSIPALFVALAWAAAATCCLHAGIFKNAVANSTVRKEVENRENIFLDAEGTGFSFLNQRRLVLLWGFALAAAVLSVHNIAVPIYLQSLHELDGDALANWQGVSSIMLALSILAASVVFDYLGTASSVTRGMLVALVLNILGLRSLTFARCGFVAVGLMASLGGVGLYVGLALPLFGLLASRAGSAVVIEKQLFSVNDATASGMVGAFWFCGDAVGVGAQLVLCPLVGVKLTILAFACSLALHAAAVALGSGVLLRAKHPGAECKAIQQWLKANGQHVHSSKDATC